MNTERSSRAATPCVWRSMMVPGGATPRSIARASIGWIHPPLAGGRFLHSSPFSPVADLSHIASERHVLCWVTTARWIHANDASAHATSRLR